MREGFNAETADMNEQKIKTKMYKLTEDLGTDHVNNYLQLGQH